MKRWFFILLLFLLLGLAAGCMGNTGEPVSWQVVEVAGKAVQVKDGTKAWHKVTIKNTGGTKAVGGQGDRYTVPDCKSFSRGTRYLSPCPWVLCPY